ncbi:MAG: metal ABC transporter solute-binding protein, Zn/Mn family, partial [Candidatus Poseidoniaceae archaeon]
AMQEVDTNNDGKMSWEEFEAMWEMDDDHEHDEEHEEGCHDTNTHESHEEYSNEADCEAAGHVWMEDHDEEGCHDVTTHETHEEYTNQADCEAAGHMWMEEEDHDDHDDEDDHDPLEEAMEEYMMSMIMEEFNHSDEDGDMLLDLDELGHFLEAMEDMEDMEEDMPVDVLIFAFDEDGDEMLSFDEYMHLWGMEDDDHHEHGNETDEGHDNETHDENETMEDMFMEMFQMMFNMSDADGNGYLDSTELEVMMEEMMEEDHEEGVAYIHLHIEEEGEYGIALPDHVELHVLSQGGHEGHDHEEEGHDHEEEGHDEEEEGHDEEGHDEELAYDPHSWLDPVAYAAQVDVVLGHLITTFPDGEDLFKANANAFKAELVKLDEQFESLSENCQDMSVVANHNAYSYMAYRYDIQFVTVHGLDPEGEPTPEDLAEVIEHIEEEGITVLYVEEYTDASSVDSIVEATGVTVKTLYTMEMAPMDTDDDYLSLMQKNFENLEAGMSCSA